MSAILEHFTRNGVKTVSKLVPSERLGSESLKYFNRVFLLTPDSFSFNVSDNSSCVLTIRQLLKRALCILLSSPVRKFNSCNVLTFGFQKSHADGEVQSLFPNHLHNYFLTEPWHELHRLVGDDIMLSLLTRCSVFVSLPDSNNLLQISGKPLSEERVKVPEFNTVTATKPAIAYINRSIILYGRPVCPNNFKIIGLPFKHVLNSNDSDLCFKMFGFKGKSWQMRRLETLTGELLKRHKKCQYAALYSYYTKSSNGQLSQYQVFGFVVAILKRVLPDTFFMNCAFKRNLKKKLWAFLKMPRFEKMTVNELIFGVSIKAIASIFDPKHQSTTMQSPSELEKIKTFIRSFMQFLFETVVVELLRSNFYITEAANSRSRLVFYRHDTWMRLTSPAIESLQESMFQPVYSISSNLTVPVNSLSKARCRLVPKDNGTFRPIMAFKKPPSTEEGNRLRASFDILKYFYEMNSGLSVFGFSGLQSKLLQYKTGCSSSGPFYLAKLDISACFDSIPHDKLFELLARMLDKKEFSVRRVDQIQLDLINNRPLKRINRVARESNYNALTGLNMNNSSITIDRVNGKFYAGEDIFRIIYDHLCNNIVQMNGKLFKQKRGIPQGSFLSTLLCSLFYGQFDRDTGLLNFPSDDLVMRYVDDFLIISPCHDRLERFAAFLQEGFPEFGIVINPKKTRFSTDSKGIFTWCGLRFNPENLDISPDYSNFEQTNIADSITSRERMTKPGQALLRQLQYFLRPKLKRLFHQNNSHDIVIYNLIQSFAMVSIKLHAYLRGLPLKTSITANFLQKCVEQVIRYCCKLVRLKNYPDLIKSVAWNSVYRVLKRKGSDYERSGLFALISIDRFPLPAAYETLLNDSLKPFFAKIKY